MYIYIYDAVAGKRKYNKTLAKLEKKITDLGLNGKIIRLEGISNTEKTIKEELKYGADTVVAVGNDHTVHKALNAVMKDKEKNPQKELPVMGVIPLEEKSGSVAGALGLHSTMRACDALLSRRLEKVNVGKINDEYFLTQLDVVGEHNEIKIGDDYSIEVKKPCNISVINIPLSKNLAREIRINFQDKNLKLYIKPSKNTKAGEMTNKSILSLRHLFITKKTEKIIADNSAEIRGKASVSCCREKINFIVGRDRNF